jgi:hypothetical protein
MQVLEEAQEGLVNKRVLLWKRSPERAQAMVTQIPEKIIYGEAVCKEALRRLYMRVKRG